MAKIIKIENGIVFIGTDNGEIKEVKRTSLNFKPNVGENVEIFGDDYNPIIIPNNHSQPPIPTQPQIIINNTRRQKYAEDRHYVDKAVYCAFAFMLGGLGIHKFYAGRTGLGIVYLLFFWTIIPSIIALIEFIVAIFNEADEYGKIYV